MPKRKSLSKKIRFEVFKRDEGATDDALAEKNS